MKTNHKLLSIILVIAMLTSIFAITASASEPTSGTCGENLTWKFDKSTGTLTISGTGEMEEFWFYGFGFFTPWSSFSSSIKTIVVEDGVTSISDGAFEDCYYTESIIIGSDVMEIHNTPFTSSGSSVKITVNGDNQHYSTDEHGVLFNKDKTMLLWYLTDDKKDSYVVPDTVTTIGSSAFSHDKAPENVVIGNNVTTIGKYAFYDCDGLKEIKIPDSVTTIGDYSFYGCEGIKEIIIPDSVTTIGKYAFCECSSLSEIIIPDSVTTISDSAFCECSSLSEIIIPDSVTTISDGAFSYCKALENVVIGNNVTTIGYSAFGFCSGIKEIVISDSVKQISGRAFQECSNLTKISIPDSVTTIGYLAFDNCYNLSDVYYEGSENEWKAIGINKSDSYLLNATIHYNHKHNPAEGDAGIYTAPTCTKKGYTTYTCYECGMEYRDDYEDASHDFSTPTYVAPPCTQKGYTIYECHCGVSALRDFVDVTGHVDSENDGICDQCNKNLNPSTTNSPDTDISGISGIFSIFTIIAELFEKLLNSFGFLKV